MGSKMDKRICGILYVVGLLFSAVPAFFLSAPPVEDALGTMGTAAYMAGIDWSKFLVEKGFFYKYGQTVFYLPVFLLIKEPALRYKVLLVTGSLITAFVPVLVYKVAVRCLGARNGNEAHDDADNGSDVIVGVSGNAVAVGSDVIIGVSGDAGADGYGEGVSISGLDAYAAGQIRVKAIFLAIVCGFMPSIMLYGKYTWAEPVLFVVPWAVILIVLKLWDVANCWAAKDTVGRGAMDCGTANVTGNEVCRAMGSGTGMESEVGNVGRGTYRKLALHRALLSAALAWVSVYAFMCHQRGVVIVIAVAMTLLIVHLIYGVKLISLWAYAINLVLALGLDRLFNYLEREIVFLGVKPKYNLLGSFLKPETYEKLFSAKGQLVLWRTIAGWLYNVAVSGMGLALLGVAACVVGLAVTVWKLVRYRHCKASGNKRFDGRLEADTIVFILGYLMHLGAFALGVMFFFLDLYGYWDGTEVVRCDHLVFGRYLESTLPVMVFLGAYVILRGAEGTRRWEDGVSLRNKGEMTDDSAREADQYGKYARKIGLKEFCRGHKGLLGLVGATVCVFAALLMIFTARIAPAMAGVDSYVHSLMSMNFCFDMTGVGLTRDIIGNLPTALSVAGGIAIVLFPVIAWLLGRKKYKIAAALVAVAYGYVYFRSFFDIVYRVDLAAATEYARFYLGH